tara:strand:+ start:71 stop:220 length:150 start_codon:yes stop_codon:yes gene_type:complete
MPNTHKKKMQNTVQSIISLSADLQFKAYLIKLELDIKKENQKWEALTQT